MKGYADMLYKLVGKEIAINSLVTEGIMGRAIKADKWLVTKAYPHFIMASKTSENGAEVRECFNIGTLIARGIISATDVKSPHYTYRLYK